MIIFYLVNRYVKIYEKTTKTRANKKVRRNTKRHRTARGGRLFNVPNVTHLIVIQVQELVTLIHEAIARVLNVVIKVYVLKEDEFLSPNRI